MNVDSLIDRCFPGAHADYSYTTRWKQQGLVLAIEEFLQCNVLHGDELMWLELGDLVPDAFAETAGKSP